MTKPFVILCLSLGLSTARAAGNASRPNVIFILADDLGWGDLGSYGQKSIQTPRLDRMAAEGMRFTQFYAGSTVCAPSRGVFMTGKHTGHSRIRGNKPRPPATEADVKLLPEDVTLAEVLKARGYRTALVGKWGLTVTDMTAGPTAHGFDEFLGYVDHFHAHNYFPTYLWRNREKVPLPNVVPDEKPDGRGVASGRVRYSHDVMAEEALAFVRRNAAEATPFFLYLPFTIPHANNEGKDDGMEVPDLGAYADRDWPLTRKQHAAMISRMDRDIGRLLDLLAELDIDERTAVFFSSDNGPHKEGGYDPEMNDSNGPLRGHKRALYEGGIRVPLIARWPGKIAAGKVSDVVGSFADVMPTLAALTGARAPRGIDGVDASAVLLGRRTALPDRLLYWEFHEGGFHQAARHGRWKAVIRSGASLELYDLASDPGESKDLAAATPNVVARMSKAIRSARTESKLWPAPAGQR